MKIFLMSVPSAVVVVPSMSAMILMSPSTPSTAPAFQIEMLREALAHKDDEVPGKTDDTEYVAEERVPVTVRMMMRAAARFSPSANLRRFRCMRGDIPAT